jgi:hypothetical protein
MASSINYRDAGWNSLRGGRAERSDNTLNGLANLLGDPQFWQGSPFRTKTTTHLNLEMT